MLEKTEWPTETRLESLREVGIVPVSLYPVRALAALSFCLTLYLMRERIRAFFSKLLILVDAGALQPTPELTQEIISEGVLILAVPTLIMALASVVAVMLQTKFLFVSSRITLDPSRLNRFKFPDLVGLLFSIGWGVSLVLILAGCVGVGAYLLLRIVLPIAGSGAKYLVRWPMVVGGSLIPLVIGALMLSGFLAWLIARFRFMLRHRMTREEVLREGSDKSAVIPI